MEQDTEVIATPLLGSLPSRRASKLQTLGNIIVSVVGTGLVGLPFAFRIAGWVAGMLGVAIAGISTYYCMLLLVYDLHLSVSVSFSVFDFFFWKWSSI
ncbi:hypothetical protein L6164_033980 [Bauhinia variegata]|uniref:Uncharacterized protein n=1 Tax=Bauhinia variegata TaxID=167791 RepID=A0ACB9KTC9_BAUVA|nr:hypothetical protein L6164_033980 [Bauhinia variegata]